MHVELATHATMVLVLGLGQPADALDRFTHDFATTVRRIERPGDAEALVRASGALVNEVVVPPREAFLGKAETVPVDEAVGRVSAEAIAGYPPGIPALLPGERITAEGVGYLRELRESGARLHGASDPDFRTIVVLCTRLTDDDLIDAALAEDVGDGDATSAATVDADARARATITQKAPGVISGLEIAAGVFRHLDPSARSCSSGRRARGARRARACSSSRATRGRC